MTLTDLQINESAWVDSVQTGRFGTGLALRLEAMGFVPDKPITLLRKAILGGPLAVRVGSTTAVAIRRDEAALIRLRRTDESNNSDDSHSPR